MFNFLKKEKEKSCFNCVNFDKKNKLCKTTKNSTLRSFPFKKTTCKTYKQK